MPHLRKIMLCLLFIVCLLITLPVYADDPSELLALVNAERANACLAPLTFSWHLSEIAIRHTQDMVDRGYFSHIAPDPAPNGVTPAERVTNGGYYWLWIGENLATGFGSPGEAFAAWMNSPGHRANILNPEFVEMGMARIGDTWTQIFGRSPNAGAPFPDCNLYGIHAAAAPIEPAPPSPVDQSVEQPQPPAEQPPVEQPIEQPQPPAEQPPAAALQPAAPVLEQSQPMAEAPRPVIEQVRVLEATSNAPVEHQTGMSTPSKNISKRFDQ